MKRNLLLFLLAVSVLFNVFFTVGYLQARAEARLAASPERLERRVAQELDLDEDQAAFFGRLRTERAEGEALFRQDLAALQQRLADELGRQQPDSELVQELLDRQSELRRRHRLEGAERFREFVGVLSPEQRMQFSKTMRHHGRDRGRGRGRGGGQHEMLRRFDLDGDGEMSPLERQKAREHMESRRQQRAARHAEKRKEFDVDGDGELDADERAAFQTWLREQAGRDPMRGRGRGRPGREKATEGDE